MGDQRAACGQVSAGCMVELGRAGPAARCGVAQHGWLDGIGGCPNEGGICVGCTLPGFPARFLDGPASTRSSTTAALRYGRMVRALRGFTTALLDGGRRVVSK